MKIPELAGFEENPFVVVAKNHPTHAANTVCLMMSEPYKTGTFYNPGGRMPYYEISDLKTDAEALYNKMPQGLKSRIIKTKTKAQIVNGASDIEGYVLPLSGKQIDTVPIINLLRQGENNADTILMQLPPKYGDIALDGLTYIMYGDSKSGTRATQVLEKEVNGEGVLLRWKISDDFTAVAGELKLMLKGFFAGR